MDNNYIPKKQYRIYSIIEAKAKASEPIYGLYDTGFAFAKYDGAYEWIETEGQRQIKYTIVEEYRKD
jgi:hypothetical protein